VVTLWRNTAGPSACTRLTRRPSRAPLTVYEQVNREVPFNGLPWFFDHCETISDRSIERIKALGGGIAVQDRIGVSGRILRGPLRQSAGGAHAAHQTHAEMGVPVGAGTDGTRVASYNPFVSLYWLVTGKTVGGTALYPEANPWSAWRPYGCTRWAAVVLWGGRQKGAIVLGQPADLPYCQPITSLSQKKLSGWSPCSRWWAARLSMVRASSHASHRRRCR